ncbi:MAG TPA: hypothetical protein VMF13_00820, partial [Luteitalea sp.]|nr:hypothetical protein [Luteitalea sp.]
MSGTPVIVRGWNARRQTVFELRWNAGRIERTDSAALADTRLLWFFDPGAPEVRLFALPVLDRLALSTSGQRHTIKGRLRSFLPEIDTGSTSSDFELELEATAAAPQVTLRKCELGRARSVTPIRLTASGLRSASLDFTFRGNPQAPAYLHPTLLALTPALGTVAGKLVWHVRTRFVEPRDETQRAQAHASFAIERRADLAVDDGKHALGPWDLEFKGTDLPVNREGDVAVRHLTISQRLPWEDAWTTTGETTHWLVQIEVPQSAVFAAWERLVVRPVQDAISLVDAGRPLTVLPTLRNPDDTGPLTWNTWWTFIDRSSEGTLERSDYKAGGPAAVGDQNAVTIVARRVTPFDGEAQPAPVARPAARASATFGSIFRTDGTAVRAECVCHTLPVGNELAPSSDDGIGFAFRLEQVKPPRPGGPPSVVTPQPVRFGALDLQLLPASRSSDDQNDRIEGLAFDADASACVAWLSLDDARPFVARGVRYRSVRLAIGVAAIAPGSQDDSIDEEYADAFVGEADLVKYRRDRPLVVTLDPPTATPWTARYRLHVFEVLAPGESQTIAFTLREVASTGGTTPRALILDSQPWLVALVEPPLLSVGAGAAESADLGNWTNRASTGAGWELRGDSGGFGLLLPPQGVGEAMHRRREDDDVAPGRPLDFRFTPPARLQLRAPHVDQRFVEPAWNLRRLTEARAGLNVIEGRVELLYGLSARFRPSGMQVSELTARMGEWPGTPDRALPWPHTPAEGALHDASRTLWLKLRRIVRSRLAVLEAWSSDQDRLLLTEADGLRIRLRDTAKLRYPLPGSPDPLPSGAPPSYFTPDGLAGGWSWGFESRNVLNAVARTPDSYAATLSDLFFSSLGGWGQQRAVFDRGLSAVIARVEMGRASTITIERLGRIGVLWNKAKHVIVYERTVAASRQFAGEQHPLVGNPVLRKVDEYIEILETERAFPERDAPAASRGFVLGALFADGQPPRIRVNSRWGRDVGDIGWMVPLWLRGAAPADVYPKPTIHLQGAGVTADDRVLLAIDDPDKLCFFTGTEPAWDSDSDTWPAVEGVDFMAVDPDSLEPPPVEDVGKVAADPRRWNATDHPVSTGVAPFTLRLQPAPAPVNYVASRTTGDVVLAVPRTVLLMRGAIVEAATASVGSRELSNLRGHVENAFDGFLSSNPSVDYGAAAAAFRKELEKAEDAYSTIKAAIGSGKICEQLAEQVSAQFRNAASQTRFEVRAALHRIERQFREEATRVVGDDIVQVRAALRSLLHHVLAGAVSARGSLRVVRGLPGEVLLRLDEVAEDLRRVNVAVSDAFDQAERGIAALADWSTVQDPPEKAALVSEARRVLDSLGVEAAAFLARGGLDQRIADVVRGWIGALVDPARILLDTGRTGCQDTLRTLADTLPTLTQVEVLGRLRDVAERAFRTMLDVLATIEDCWRELFEQAPEQAWSPDEGLKDRAWPLDEALDTLQRHLHDAIDRIDDLSHLGEAIDAVSRRMYEEIDAQLDGLIARTLAAEPFSALVRAACERLVADLAALDAYVTRWLRPDLLDSLRSRLEGLSPDALQREIDALLGGVLDS